MKKTFLVFIFIFLFFVCQPAFAHQPQLIYYAAGNINVSNPEISQAFYDQLQGAPRDYFINSAKDFNLYVNVLVPELANPSGRYSFKIFSLQNSQENIVADISDLSNWQEFYEPFGRDYYLKGPEFEKQVLAGQYKIEVYSANNQGKYVLAVGKEEFYGIKQLLNVYWQLPLLKMAFFNTSVLQFFLTPFGIGGLSAIGALLIFLAVINYLIALIKEKFRQKMAKTLLLTSNGMQVKEQIIKLLQKPAYDINVAYITTAAKPEEDVSYLEKDWETMKEVGFNIEEVDIEGKSERQLLKIFEPKDIIFVAGGNTFYLLRAMRECHFVKVMEKLLKRGIVYIGASAGSIVAGKTIQTARWLGDKNNIGLKKIKGLNLVPFDIFVHYQPEHAQIIKKKKPFRWQRRHLKILTDDQAVLVQGKQIIVIGQGEEITL